jgi:hypothetical protein
MIGEQLFATLQQLGLRWRMDWARLCKACEQRLPDMIFSVEVDIRST